MSGNCLDHELTRKMAALIEQLTTSGSPSLDAEVMKKLKRICQTSDLYVEHAFRQLMAQLEKEHAEIRLSTFQIIDELFNRSHVFRELLVSDLQNFLELTVETDQDQPLPPPKAAARKLKTDTLKAVQQWHEKYSSGYKKLALGYYYLKTCKHVDFNDIRARSIAERRRAEQQELQKQRALQAKLEKVRKEIMEMKNDMLNAATEAENCIDLLLPRPESFLFDESDFLTPSTEQPSRTSEKISSSQSSDGKKPGRSGLNSNNDESHSKRQKHDTKQDIDAKVNVCLSESEKSEEACIDRQDHGKKCSNQERVSSVTSCKCSNENSHNAGEGSASNEIIVKKTDKEMTLSSTGSEDEEMLSVDKDSDSDEDFEEVVDEDAAAYDRRMVQAHGLGNRKYELQIEIGTDGVSLRETEDNRDLYRNLKDASCLISMRHLPQVIKWLEVLGKCGGSQTEIKMMIDLKLRLEHVKSKCTELHLEPDANEQQAKEKGSDSDEDLEEVPEKEGYEPHIPSHLRAEYGLPPVPDQQQTPKPSTSGSQMKRTASGAQGKARSPGKPERRDSTGSSQKATSAFWSLAERNKAATAQDPTSRAANLAKLGIREEYLASRSGSSKEKPATVTSAGSSQVPTLLFGKDLAYWGNTDKIEAPTIVKNDSLHRFWVPAQVEHEKPSQHDVAAVMNRTFHYVGDFVPVKWKCRARLPSGKLCDRMDRVKCPFHGKIIPRDQNGDPSSPEDVKVKGEKPEAGQSGHGKKQEPDQSDLGEVPPWQDAELQAEIEAATGHDLGSERSKAKASRESKGKGKGKGRKKKYPGLTDIHEVKNTSRTRLESKVFNKSSLKRIASRLDAADYKRVRDKFANQFNYAYKK